MNHLSLHQPLPDQQWLQAPYFPFMQQLVEQLIARQPLRHVLMLETEAKAHFACSGCGQCCQRPWTVDVSKEYIDTWQAIFEQDKHYLQPFELTPNRSFYGEIRKKQGTHECLFLQDDRTCMIHSRYGHEALPTTCQMFPRYESWFGSYLGRFMVNSCPDVNTLTQSHPHLAYRVALIEDNAWDVFAERKHPMGIENGLLWLSWQQDLIMRQASWTPVERLRWLHAQLLRLDPQRLGQLLPQTFDLFERDLQTALHAGKPLPSPGEEGLALKWLIHFTRRYPPIQQFLQQLQFNYKKVPHLPEAERLKLNHFLQRYLFYRISALPIFHPSRKQTIFFPSYFLLSVHVALWQFLVLYYRQREGGEWQDEHMARAANLIGYRFEHDQNFALKHDIYHMSPQHCLEGMAVLLSFDLGSLASKEQ